MTININDRKALYEQLHAMVTTAKDDLNAAEEFANANGLAFNFEVGPMHGTFFPKKNLELFKQSVVAGREDSEFANQIEADSDVGEGRNDGVYIPQYVKDSYYSGWYSSFWGNY